VRWRLEYTPRSQKRPLLLFCGGPKDTNAGATATAAAAVAVAAVLGGRSSSCFVVH